jgi:AcrR family transcriptional regulator
MSHKPSIANDLRVRRTRKSLREALVSLIETRGFDTLKVSDITEYAMINRATFYRHYRDKEDLLMHCMDDVFEDLLSQLIMPVYDINELDYSIPHTNLKKIFAHIAEHAQFYRVMLGKDGASAFVSRLRMYLQQVATDRWNSSTRNTAGAVNPLVPPELMISFIASGYIGVIVWWVERGCVESPEQMADYILVLTMQGTLRAFGVPPLE